MSLQTVARRYATALADVAISKREERQIQSELQVWASMIETNPQLKEVFANPTVPHDQKRRVLQELITRTRAAETTAAFLQVLLMNQRLAQLKEIVERFGQILDERAGVVAAHVTTARPVPEAQQHALREALTRVTGSSVRLRFETDESIIGGLVARVGSTIFDGSLESQLQRLASEMTSQ
ncbi:MAG TPA: ATP synthase F1 subunit delta [Pyrinomonadaceae bacterium]|nr:ATP synthase F1 subunit delta [Pyrinomonadaceae bacterium]